MNIRLTYTNAKLIHRHLGISYPELAIYYISKREGSKSVSVNYNSANVRFSDLSNIARLLENEWKIIQTSEKLITFRSPDDVIITCRCNVGYDFGHLVEIFLEKSYGSDFNNKNIIDIGASNGDSAIYFAKKGAKRVVCLEPDTRSFELAVNNLKASKVEDRVTILNKALSNKDGEIKLFVYDMNPNANSVDKSNMVHLKDTMHEETVESITVKDVIGMFEGEQIDLLKMDCEGCKYSVLRNLDAESYKKIKSIVMEYHNGLQFLKGLLESYGFNVEVKAGNDKIGYISANRVRLLN
ncbi:FkbM family methyltransferase [Picrophilus oshimae]|uniref:Methyltransferase, FkbM family n=1 Tax=Picrophilus torridus (strain ATCC 700027 / DSM 9790 / JCM 10055 / NBRC 100828 / KAW 2/3) TaxID=1122961 RepID=A0A8G2L781_PICTO|nr:FkbM family methyltransferase [Picrophilus oshimae]SMD30778.1 methyltransferase, FkbM family [Picrophilus oshimae DSM 9789]